MSALAWDWLAPLLATDAPVLPQAGLVEVNLSLGWSVVLAWLGAWGVARWTSRPGVQAGVALLLALWAWLPGAFTPDYWLGLAFQAPSLVTTLLCAGLLWDRLARTPAHGPQPAQRSALALAVLGMSAGWALLADTFARLPVPLYAWGFSPLVTALVLLAAALPWVLWRDGRRPWLVPLAVLVFAVLRLPSGNVWDAVLDPWLWLVLHGYLLRAIRRRT